MDLHGFFILPRLFVCEGKAIRFSLKTIAFLTAFVAISLTAITAAEKMTIEPAYAHLPVSIVFTLVYLILLFSILRLMFDRTNNRPFHAGIVVILTGYFLAKPIGMNPFCNIDPQWWYPIMKSRSIQTAATSSAIGSVSVWLIVAVIAGIYAKYLSERTCPAE